MVLAEAARHAHNWSMESPVTMAQTYSVTVTKESGPNRFRATVTFPSGRIEALPTAPTHNDALQMGLSYLKPAYVLLEPWETL